MGHPLQESGTRETGVSDRSLGAGSAAVPGAGSAAVPGAGSAAVPGCCGLRGFRSAAVLECSMTTLPRSGSRIQMPWMAVHPWSWWWDSGRHRPSCRRRAAPTAQRFLSADGLNALLLTQSQERHQSWLATRATTSGAFANPGRAEPAGQLRRRRQRRPSLATTANCASPSIAAPAPASNCSEPSEPAPEPTHPAVKPLGRSR